MNEDAPERLSRLEARVHDLEMLVNMLIRVTATMRPLGNLLESFGATEAQEKSVLRLIDEMAGRVDGGRDAPSYAYFEDRLFELLPHQRGNRELTGLLVETLKVERPSYQRLYKYIKEQRWPIAEV